MKFFEQPCVVKLGFQTSSISRRILGLKLKGLSRQCLMNSPQSLYDDRWIANEV